MQAQDMRSRVVVFTAEAVLFTAQAVVFTALVGTLAGCGGAGANTPAAVAVAPAPGRFQFDPSRTSYEGVSHRVVARSVDGRMLQDGFVLLYHITAEITDADSTLLAAFIIDTVLDATAQNILPKEIGTATGTRFRASLSRSGVLGALSGGDATSVLAGQLARQIEDFFPRVPEDGLRPNATWADTTETIRQEVGAEIAVRAVTNYRSDDWQLNPEGLRVMRVHWDRRYTLHGSGDQFGQAFTIEGTGTVRGISLLSSDGRFLGSTREDELNGRIVLVSIGETTQLRQTQADTIRVRR